MEDKTNDLEKKLQEIRNIQIEIDAEKEKNNIKITDKITPKEKYKILLKLKNLYMEIPSYTESNKKIYIMTSKLATEILEYIYSEDILTNIYDRKIKIYKRVRENEEKYSNYLFKNWELSALIIECLFLKDCKIEKKFLNILDRGFIDGIFLDSVFYFLEKNNLISSFYEMFNNNSISSINIHIFDFLRFYKIITIEQIKKIDESFISIYQNVNQIHLISIPYENYDYEYLTDLANQQMEIIQNFYCYKYININCLKSVLNNLIAEVSLLDEFSIKQIDTIEEKINNTPIKKQINFQGNIEIKQLSNTQKDILNLMVNNYDKDMIATKLYISKKTLENSHLRTISSILKQTGVIAKGGFNNIKKYINKFTINIEKWHFSKNLLKILVK